MSDKTDARTPDPASLPALHARVEALFEPLGALADGEDTAELDELTRRLVERMSTWFDAVEAAAHAAIGDDDPKALDALEGDHAGAREIVKEMRALVHDAREDLPVDREHLAASVHAAQIALQEQMQRERDTLWARLGIETE